MFKCKICGKVTRPGEKQTKKVIKTRKKEYCNMDKNEREKISKGIEIVQEINICEKCANQEG